MSILVHLPSTLLTTTPHNIDTTMEKVLAFVISLFSGRDFFPRCVSSSTRKDEQNKDLFETNEGQLAVRNSPLEP